MVLWYNFCIICTLGLSVFTRDYAVLGTKRGECLMKVDAKIDTKG